MGGKGDDAPETCQVIFPDMTYNEELADYMVSNGLGEQGSKFHVVGIIGGQSSGKSTLMNRMFATGFDMMDSKKGRQQTTKGIWCAKAADSDTLVMDVEGTDGREKEDQKAFEGKSAMFCLALTDVLMVNMWMHEVGRFNAANLPLLKTVFEVHLRLLRDEKEGDRARPLLLFILRDCDGSTPVEALQETIVTDLNKIWKDMAKPDCYAGSALDDFFEVQCEELPHFVYQKDDWEKRVGEVSQRFSSPKDKGYVFKGRDSKDVPADGFSLFASQLWHTIENDGDLDLPSQRKMLSMVRCEQIRKERLGLFQKGVNGWLGDLTSDTFKETAGKQVTALVDKFLHDTSGYDATVSHEASEKLLKEVWPLLQDAHDGFVREAREEAERKFSGDLSVMVPDEGEMPQTGFSARVEGLAEESRDSFRAAVAKLTPQGAPWKERLYEQDGPFDIFNAHLKREGAAAKKQVAAMVQVACELQLKKKLSMALVALLDVSAPLMWTGIRKAHEVAVSEAADRMKSILLDVGMWSEADFEKSRSTLRQYADVLVNDKVGDKAGEGSLIEKMFSKFDAEFNREKTRTWRLWDQPDTEFEKAKVVGLWVLEMFSESQLYDDGMWPKGQSKIKYIDEDRRDMLKADFEARVRKELSWAQMSKANSSTHSTLMVGGLFLVLGWNEILWLLRNPLYLILLCIAVAGGAVYYFLSKVGDVNQLIALVVQKFTGVMAAPGKQGGVHPSVAHAAHLAGPSGREKRPQTAPVTRSSAAASGGATRVASID
mmetsp:Transcript_47841/g.116488  ORF Transcript_47841/g.116488 Transcript_47841/m.116488 type:complete len:771 (+) Transcript_47841:208-2520(+)